MLIHVYLKDNFVLTILIKHNIDDDFNLNIPILNTLNHKCGINFFIKVKKSTKVIVKTWGFITNKLY